MENMEWKMNFKWGGIYLKRSSVHSLCISPQWQCGSLHSTTRHMSRPHPPCLTVSGLVSAGGGGGDATSRGATRAPDHHRHTPDPHLGGGRHLATSPPGLSLQSMVASVVINIVINMQTPDQPDSDHAL